MAWMSSAYLRVDWARAGRWPMCLQRGLFSISHRGAWKEPRTKDKRRTSTALPTQHAWPFTRTAEKCVCDGRGRREKSALAEGGFSCCGPLTHHDLDQSPDLYCMGHPQAWGSKAGDSALLRLPFCEAFETNQQKFLLPSFPFFPQRQGLNLGQYSIAESWTRLCAISLSAPSRSQKGRKRCSYREEGNRKTDGKYSELEQVLFKQYNRSLLLQNNRTLLWKSIYNRAIDNKDNREIILWTWIERTFCERS